MLFLQRISLLKKKLQDDAVSVALWRKDIEVRIGYLENRNSETHELLNKIFKTVLELSNKSACLKDLNSVKEELMREINRVEKELLKSR